MLSTSFPGQVFLTLVQNKNPVSRSRIGGPMSSTLQQQNDRFAKYIHIHNPFGLFGVKYLYEAVCAVL